MLLSSRLWPDSFYAKVQKQMLFMLTFHYFLKAYSGYKCPSFGYFSPDTAVKFNSSGQMIFFGLKGGLHH